MKVLWVLIATSPFLLNAVLSRKEMKLAKRLLLYWAFSTAYGVIGFAIAFFGYK